MSSIKKKAFLSILHILKIPKLGLVQHDNQVKLNHIWKGTRKYLEWILEGIERDMALGELGESRNEFGIHL